MNMANARCSFKRYDASVGASPVGRAAPLNPEPEPNKRPPEALTTSAHPLMLSRSHRLNAVFAARQWPVTNRFRTMVIEPSRVSLSMTSLQTTHLKLRITPKPGKVKQEGI